MSDRRETLKIIGAIGSTCAFPYSADELYGQHNHAAAEQAAALPAKPTFFSESEYETVKRLADLIIPRTETPGAVDAGVPQYIDFVVNSNAEWKKLFREGLAWLDRAAGKQGGRFVELSEEKQVALLEPVSAAADRIRPPLTVGRNQAIGGRQDRSPLEVRFFKAFKSMTADGFFTSKAGLVEVLGYRGNSVLAEFPSCIHEH